MLKAALLGTAVFAAVSTAAVELAVGQLAAAPAASAPCVPAASVTLACATRAADANGDGAMSANELANLVVPPAPAGDWTWLRPMQEGGLDFKDAAAEPASVLAGSLDHDSSHPLIPAVFALGALVILLRRRPN